MSREDVIEIRQQEAKSPGAKGNVTQMLNIETILADVRQLKQILLQEAEILKARKYNQIKALLEEKLRLIRRIEIQKQLVQEHGTLLGEFSVAQKTDLQSLAQEMDVVMWHNLREVVKAKEINERVVKVIGDTLAAQERPQGYNAEGQGGARVKGDYAFAFNESV